MIDFYNKYKFYLIRDKENWNYICTQKDFLDTINVNISDYNSEIYNSKFDQENKQRKNRKLPLFESELQADIYHIINYTYFLLSIKHQLDLSLNHSKIKRVGKIILMLRLSIAKIQPTTNYYIETWGVVSSLFDEKYLKTSVSKTQRPNINKKAIKNLFVQGYNTNEMIKDFKSLEDIFFLTNAPLEFELLIDYKRVLDFNLFLNRHILLEKHNYNIKLLQLKPNPQKPPKITKFIKI